MQDFMGMACEEALLGILAGDGGPFGAVIVKDEKVIAAGHNSVFLNKDSTAHAEITAIRKAEQELGTHDLTGCELYTTCYPCPMCYGAIMWARISKVYYGSTPEEAADIGFDDKKFYEAISSPNINSTLSLINKSSKECSTLFEVWSKIDNKKMY